MRAVDGSGICSVQVYVFTPSHDDETWVLVLKHMLGLQAYLAGLTFALAASPCSTPVLATLLAYVSTADNPAAGAALLFCYCLGYVAPLLTAAAFTGALSRCGASVQLVP